MQLPTTTTAIAHGGSPPEAFTAMDSGGDGGDGGEGGDGGKGGGADGGAGLQPTMEGEARHGSTGVLTQMHIFTSEP